MVKPIPQVGAREIALSRGYMVHVFADGEPFLVMELQSQGVEKFYRTSAMSMLAKKTSTKVDSIKRNINLGLSSMSSNTAFENSHRLNPLSICCAMPVRKLNT